MVAEATTLIVEGAGWEEEGSDSMMPRDPRETSTRGLTATREQRRRLSRRRQSARDMLLKTAATAPRRKQLPLYTGVWTSGNPSYPALGVLGFIVVQVSRRIEEALDQSVKRSDEEEVEGKRCQEGDEEQEGDASQDVDQGNREQET